MGLNIKNERVHALARQAAAAIGRTQTGAIEMALEQMLERHGIAPDAAQVEAKLDVARAIVEEYKATPGGANAEVRTDEDLYDTETGLPR